MSHIIVSSPVPYAMSPVQPAAESRSSLLRQFLRQYAESPVAVAAITLLLLLTLAAFCAPIVAPQDPYDLGAVSIVSADLPPGTDGGVMTHWLGTDGAGRDLLSAILYGLRTSIGIAMVSAITAFLIGTSVGLIAAYFGGRVDAFIMRIVDLQLSVPTILVALMLLGALGQGVDKTLLALIIVQWAYYARNVRGSAMVERSKEYVEASMSQGLPARHIMFRHILPNCTAPLLVTATLQTGHAITLEATMSFLGIGLPQTEPSLGLLVANGFESMLSNQYWVSMFPGIALVLLVASINLIGDRLRTVLNPKFDR